MSKRTKIHSAILSVILLLVAGVVVASTYATFGYVNAADEDVADVIENHGGTVQPLECQEDSGGDGTYATQAYVNACDDELIEMINTIPSQHYIGQNLPAEGGIVFFLEPPPPLGDGVHTGLIVALTDACSGCTWGSPSNSVTTSVELFSGANTVGHNTYNMNDSSMNPGLSPAATACINYRDSNNHMDWYLPAQKELDLLYAESTILNSALTSASGHTFTGGFYWSSSQVDSGNAWVVDFGSGDQGYGYKDSTDLVRCVRAF